jgi:hypothetical protein
MLLNDYMTDARNHRILKVLCCGHEFHILLVSCHGNPPGVKQRDNLPHLARP